MLGISWPFLFEISCRDWECEGKSRGGVPYLLLFFFGNNWQLFSTVLVFFVKGNPDRRGPYVGSSILA
jgi:hypothetical protein